MVQPSDRMKMDRDHHVPPSDRVVEILREQMARRSTSSFGDHPVAAASNSDSTKPAYHI